MTITILSPTSVGTNDGWTGLSGTPITQLSDGSDATYATASTTGQLQLFCSIDSAYSGQSILEVRIPLRIKGDNSVGLDCQWLNGSGSIVGATYVPPSSATNATVLVAKTLDTGAAITSSDVNGGSIRFDWLGTPPAGNAMYEAAFDVVVADAAPGLKAG